MITDEARRRIHAVTKQQQRRLDVLDRWQRVYDKPNWIVRAWRELRGSIACP